MQSVGKRIENFFDISPAKFLIWVMIFVSLVCMVYIFKDNLEKNEHIIADEYRDAKEIHDEYCIKTPTIQSIIKICEDAHVILERNNRTHAIANTLREYFTFKDTDRMALYLSAFWDKIFLTVVFLLAIGFISTMLCGCSVITGSSKGGRYDYNVPMYRSESEIKKNE